MLNDTFIHLQGDKFPGSLRLMTGVQWLKLDRTNLAEISEEMGKLVKLVSYEEYTKHPGPVN